MLKYKLATRSYNCAQFALLSRRVVLKQLWTQSRLKCLEVNYKVEKWSINEKPNSTVIGFDIHGLTCPA
jgi:hypothetical protein